MFLGLLWCNVGIANNNLIFIKCYISKAYWPYIKIDFDKKQVTYLIKTKSGHRVQSDWPSEFQTSEKSIFKITNLKISRRNEDPTTT